MIISMTAINTFAPSQVLILSVSSAAAFAPIALSLLSLARSLSPLCHDKIVRSSKSTTGGTKLYVRRVNKDKNERKVRGRAYPSFAAVVSFSPPSAHRTPFPSIKRFASKEGGWTERENISDATPQKGGQCCALSHTPSCFPSFYIQPLSSPFFPH